MRLSEHYFSPRGKFIWDCWFTRRPGRCHAFFLQARRTRDPEQRHNNKVSIGHAVSHNLRDWKEQPAALRPGRSGAWDDLSLWTGSIIRRGDRYYLFYTGRERRPGRMWIQKIGLALSSDLLHWEKHPDNPVVECDERYYQLTNSKNGLGKIGAWRDPFVFRDPVSGGYCMTISARTAGSRREYNGCIALAQSDDLIRWRVGRPLLSPGRYDEMECSQMVFHEGRYYLFFSTWKEGYHPAWARRVEPRTGLHCYYARDLRGEFRPVNQDGVVLDYGEALYGAAVIQKQRDQVLCMGWRNRDRRGKFLGTLSDPIILRLKGDEVRRV